MDILVLRWEHAWSVHTFGNCFADAAQRLGIILLMLIVDATESLHLESVAHVLLSL